MESLILKNFLNLWSPLSSLPKLEIDGSKEAEEKRRRICAHWLTEKYTPLWCEFANWNNIALALRKQGYKSEMLPAAIRPNRAYSNLEQRIANLRIGGPEAAVTLVLKDERPATVDTAQTIIARAIDYWLTPRHMPKPDERKLDVLMVRVAKAGKKLAERLHTVRGDETDAQANAWNPEQEQSSRVVGQRTSTH